QGMGGLMSMTGLPDEAPGGGPMKTGIAIGDAMAGMYASTAILAALQQRHATGRGQHIDISLLDCVVALTSYMSANYFVADRLPKRLGNAHANIAPYQVFRCKQGDVILGVGNNSQYVSFCGAIGRPDLATDARFASGEQRLRHRDVLIPILEQVFLRRTMAEWVELLNRHNVPCGPINTLKEVFEDPQVRHRGLRISMPHAAGVEAPGVASPLRLSDSPVTYDMPPPMLGQHTQAVLAGLLEKTDAEIQALRERRVI
ncbi:MAG: CoA transferase, partial [Comamonadaceae bacterium]